MIRRMYVGTYTEPILFGTGEVFQGKGRGVYACDFEDGRLTPGELIPLRNPSFLCVDRVRERLYAVNEMKEFGGEAGGGVTVLSLGRAGGFAMRQTFCTGGGDPCYITLSPDKSALIVANFASGSVAAWAVDARGDLAEARQLFEHRGSSVHPMRQRGPHAHSVIFADREWFYVPDLGMDCLAAYRVREGEVTRESARDVPVAPGSGPRYGEFSADGRHFYLVNELSSTVMHFTREDGVMTCRETLSTLPSDYTGSSTCSDLHLSPDGQFLYASNRGHDSIAVFRLSADGAPELKDIVSCHGRTPRNFTLDPTGRYLLCGNQDSDTIAIFDVLSDGCLRLKSAVPFPSPVCLSFPSI